MLLHDPWKSTSSWWNELSSGRFLAFPVQPTANLRQVNRLQVNGVQSSFCYMILKSTMLYGYQRKYLKFFCNIVGVDDLKLSRNIWEIGNLKTLP